MNHMSIDLGEPAQPWIKLICLNRESFKQAPPDRKGAQHIIMLLKQIRIPAG